MTPNVGPTIITMLYPDYVDYDTVTPDFSETPIWVVVKMMVPFWIPIIIRHLVFGYPRRDHNLDNHAFMCEENASLCCVADFSQALTAAPQASLRKTEEV